MQKKTLVLLSFFLVASLFLPVLSQDGQAATSDERLANSIVRLGLKYYGAPYVFGVSLNYAPRYFDCSSFTKYVYGKHGIYLPRSSKYQARMGKYVPTSKLRRGDLMFFNVTRRPGIDHVAIYVGDGKILHTYGPGGVRVDYLSSYWRKGFVVAKRVF
ncbi:MAG: C40 family peptidase [Bacillaceae bacterium]|nr:C40 family peptidase [Bacillaceae bacterium]